MDIHLDIIEKKAKERRSDLIAFRKNAIKSNAKAFDALLLPVAGSISADIDCTQCANCCKKLEAGISVEEMHALAALRGQSATDFLSSETETEETSGVTYLKKKPCIFLTGNLCCIYNARPKACRNFPDLSRPLVKYRIRKILDLYSICPIVFHTIETLMTNYPSLIAKDK